MEVKMKRYEKQCIDYSERFKRNWEWYCLVKDAWLAGYAQAKANFTEFETEPETLIAENGSHQIGEKLTYPGGANGQTEKTS